MWRAGGEGCRRPVAAPLQSQVPYAGPRPQRSLGSHSPDFYWQRETLVLYCGCSEVWFCFLGALSGDA